ncbi:MAG: hypothetical protein V1888_02995, partial [archaeon]
YSASSGSTVYYQMQWMPSGGTWSTWENLGPASCVNCKSAPQNTVGTYVFRVRACGDISSNYCSAPSNIDVYKVVDAGVVLSALVPTGFYFNIEKNSIMEGDSISFGYGGSNVNHYEFKWKNSKDDWSSVEWVALPGISSCPYWNSCGTVKQAAIGNYDIQLRACGGIGEGNSCTDPRDIKYTVEAGSGMVKTSDLKKELKMVELIKIEKMDFNYLNSQVYNGGEIEKTIAYLDDLSNQDLRAYLSCGNQDLGCQEESFKLMSLLARYKAENDPIDKSINDNAFGGEASGEFLTTMFYKSAFDNTNTISDEVKKDALGSAIWVVDNTFDSVEEFSDFGIVGHSDFITQPATSVPDSADWYNGMVVIMPSDDYSDAEKEVMKTVIKQYHSRVLGELANEGKVEYSFTYLTSAFSWLIKAKAISDPQAYNADGLDYDYIVDRVAERLSAQGVSLDSNEREAMKYLLKLPNIPEFSYRNPTNTNIPFGYNTDMSYYISENELNYNKAVSSIIGNGGLNLASDWFYREVYCSQISGYATFLATSFTDRGKIDGDVFTYTTDKGVTKSVDLSRLVMSPADVLVWLVRDMGWEVVYSDVEGYSDEADIIALENKIKNSRDSKLIYEVMSPYGVDPNSREYKDNLINNVDVAFWGKETWDDVFDLGLGGAQSLGFYGGKQKVLHQKRVLEMGVRYGALYKGLYLEGMDESEIDLGLDSLIEKLIDYKTPFYMTQCDPDGTGAISSDCKSVRRDSE